VFSDLAGIFLAAFALHCPFHRLLVFLQLLSNSLETISLVSGLLLRVLQGQDGAVRAVYSVLLGCAKLEISVDGCKVVLEEDGTEIDDDEILQESVDSILMILQRDENWSSASEQSKQLQTAKQKPTDKGNSVTLPKSVWSRVMRTR